MANVTFYQSYDMQNPTMLYGDRFLLTSTKFSVSDSAGNSASYLGSNLSYRGYSVIGGTVTGFESYKNSSILLTITNANVNARTLQSFVDTGNRKGIEELAATGNDSVIGSSFDDSLLGYSGNDLIKGGGGNDFIDGGIGIDTAVYTGTATSYIPTLGATSSTIMDRTANRDGTDTLTNIERLQFSDKSIALDLAPTQAAGQTALLMGAVLPGRLVYDVSKQALLGSVIGLFDQNFTLAQLSGAILRLPIWDVLTGKAAPTTADIATYLVHNVYGGTETTAITNAAITAMNAETPATQGTYLASLAVSTASQSHIDLVGIQATGLVYLG
jgi:hypothetical protein